MELTLTKKIVAFLVIAAAFAGTLLVVHNLDLREEARAVETKVDLKALKERVAVAEINVAEMQRRALEREAEQEALGATNKIPDLRALFESSLAAKITTTATSFTLTSATDKDGNTLASSTYAFIIDEGTANEEMVLADCTGTACTNAVRGLSALTGTTTVSTLRKAHGRGASVKITDGPQLLILNRLLQGRDTFTNALAYDTTSVPSTTFSGSNKGGLLASVDYVNYVTVSGCADASLTVRGCVELASGAEAASSTSLGGTGASLVLTGAMATDTPTQTTFSASKVVMSDLTGFIKQAWIKLSDTFTWTGLHTFSSGALMTASSTHSATTSVAASNVNSNAFILNALAYAFPSSRGAANTVLTENGAGTLSWNSIGTLVVASSTQAATTSGQTISNTSTETTYTSNGTMTLPANKMGTNGTLRMRVLISDLDHAAEATANNQINFKFKLGGTTVCDLQGESATNGGSNMKGEVICELHNKNSASSQVALGNMMIVSTSGGTAGAKTDIDSAVPAINTATDQAITLTIQWATANAGNTVTIAGFSAVVY